MTTLKRSGPRRSPRGVDPTTSQTRAVTIRRLPSPPAARMRSATAPGTKARRASRCSAVTVARRACSAGGLVLADALRDRVQEVEGEFWVRVQDPLEVPARQGQAGGGLPGDHRR